MDFFKRDLDFMLTGYASQEIRILSGQLKDKIVRGDWYTNHRNRNLEGVPISTNGPCFLCAADSIEGLETTDFIEYEGKSYALSNIMKDAIGLAVIETQEKLDRKKKSKLKF